MISMKVTKSEREHILLEREQPRHSHRDIWGFDMTLTHRHLKAKPKHKHKRLRDVNGGPWRATDDLG